MNEAEKQKIITELKNFYKELRSYKNRQLRKHKTKFTEAQNRSLDALRLKLQRDHGRLKEVVSEYGGSAYIPVPVLGTRYEVFSHSLGTLKMEFRGFDALDGAIGLVNKAIGALEAARLTDIESQEVSVLQAPKAFISHGKRPSALKKLCDFLKALGIEPLVVEEEPSLDKTVDDKVNHYLDQADFVIILATGDDEIKSKLYPRQNVIHEIGLAQNTHAGKIIYLLEERAQFPSNISPKVHARFTPQSMDRAFIAIPRELKEFGILKAVKP